MDATVTFLLENVKQLVMYHVNLISGAKDELNLLQNELELLKAKLEDTSRVGKKEEVFKKWEKQIREAVYKVEDTIDNCITMIAAEKAKRIFKRNFVTSSRISLAKEVKALRDGVVKSVLNPAVTHFANLPASDPIRGAPERASDQVRMKLRTEHIVGLEKDTEILIKHLKEESDRLDVLSIIGLPGLGKTTLAWKIFQDQEITFNFHVRIWVTVSQDMNKKDVFFRILEKFVQPKELAGMNNSKELAELVKEKLKNGKFLIIMDDVWSPEAWNEIKEAMPMDNGMGRVLITTRNMKVAYHANVRRDPYKLDFLSKEKSWELLQYEVFGELDVVDTELKNVGEQIAWNCGGLPLSIVLIAGILVDKIAENRGVITQIKKAWEEIPLRVEEFLMNEDRQGRMSDIISLSYTRLPYNLRDSFLYLGIFPEDAEITFWELALLWIAEGFIHGNPRKSLEKAALDNLNDLISRNLVMVAKTKLDGEVKSFRVHDTIREFCRKEAGFDNHNLFQEVKLNEEGVFEPRNIDAYRRLCVHTCVHEFFLTKPKTPARSFLCFSKDIIELEAEEIPFVTDAFTLLRVLHAEKIKFLKPPSKLFLLLHLRYLTLSLPDEMSLLPDAIFKLWNLQTLIVHTQSRKLEIKADIWKMIQLRHLKTKASSITLSLSNIKGEYGENLKTLSRLSPESCKDNIFAKAKNLNALAILGDISKLSESSCLEKLKLLNKLKLEHDPRPYSAVELPLTSLPQTNGFPPTVRILTLKSTYLKWKQMSTLGNLPKLEVLKIKDHAFMGDVWDVLDDGFTQLAFLYIKRTDLVSWKASSRAFPELKSLTLEHCEKLNEVPLTVGKKLERLSLHHVTRSAVISAEKIEQQKEKVLKVKRGGFKLLIGAGDRIVSKS